MKSVYPGRFHDFVLSFRLKLNEPVDSMEICARAFKQYTHSFVHRRRKHHVVRKMNEPTLVEVELIREELEVRNRKLCIVTYTQTWQVDKKKLNGNLQKEEEKNVTWLI